MNKKTRTQKEPDYFYRRHMGSFKLYRNNHDGTADKIDQSWDEETIRKKTYGLNGWDYKPKSELKQHV